MRFLSRPQTGTEQTQPRFSKAYRSVRYFNWLFDREKNWKIIDIDIIVQAPYSENLFQYDWVRSIELMNVRADRATKLAKLKQGQSPVESGDAEFVVKVVLDTWKTEHRRDRYICIVISLERT